MKDERKYFIPHPSYLKKGGMALTPTLAKGQGGFEVDVSFISTLNTKEPSIFTRTIFMGMTKGP